MPRGILLSIGLLAALAPRAGAGVVYSNDFSNGAGSEWSDSSTATSNGERFLASSALGFGNMTDTLTLSDLASHGSVTVSFDLYIIQSMDGNGPNGGGPDNWRFDENGTHVLLTNFANYTGGNTQS